MASMEARAGAGEGERLDRKAYWWLGAGGVAAALVGAVIDQGWLVGAGLVLAIGGFGARALTNPDRK